MACWVLDAKSDDAGSFVLVELQAASANSMLLYPAKRIETRALTRSRRTVGTAKSGWQRAVTDSMSATLGW